jgi:hypothetical protein
MQIAATHSHLNGLEFLLVQKHALWSEVQSVIADIDADAFRQQPSKEQRVSSQAKYSRHHINRRFMELLRRQNWHQSQVPHWESRFEKDRVALEVQFGKYAFVAYDLFVKHLAFYVRDEIDVGIEILPMKSLQHHMSSGPAYYEGELYNVIRNGRGVPAVPLVMIGIAP